MLLHILPKFIQTGVIFCIDIYQQICNEKRGDLVTILVRTIQTHLLVLTSKANSEFPSRYTITSRHRITTPTTGPHRLPPLHPRYLYQHSRGYFLIVLGSSHIVKYFLFPVMYTFFALSTSSSLLGIKVLRCYSSNLNLK